MLSTNKVGTKVELIGTQRNKKNVCSCKNENYNKLGQVSTFRLFPIFDRRFVTQKVNTRTQIIKNLNNPGYSLNVDRLNGVTCNISKEEKLKIADKDASCNYSFFMGAAKENIDKLGELELMDGCCGVKIFMGSSTGDLLVEDDDSLKKILSNINRRVAIHSEDEYRLRERKKILDGETETKKNNLSLKNIFADIDFFSTDDEGQNSIRFDARTIEQLFKDTNYNLQRVRETKLVNIGNKIDHLPKEIKSIESSKKRKRLFIQIVLPLIVEENAKIRLDRKELFRILAKNINTQKEKNWLKEKLNRQTPKNN